MGERQRWGTDRLKQFLLPKRNNNKKSNQNICRRRLRINTQTIGPFFKSRLWAQKLPEIIRLQSGERARVKSILHVRVLGLSFKVKLDETWQTSNKSANFPLCFVNISFFSSPSVFSVFCLDFACCFVRIRFFFTILLPLASHSLSWCSFSFGISDMFEKKREREKKGKKDWLFRHLTFNWCLLTCWKACFRFFETSKIEDKWWGSAASALNATEDQEMERESERERGQKWKQDIVGLIFKANLRRVWAIWS